MRLLVLLFLTTLLHADPVRIHVFVALADNKHQGILPVPAKIGNGDDPAHNLYWGCSEALKPVFKATHDWKLTSTAPGPKQNILERVIFTHKSGKWQLVADAYRGSAIRECTEDFLAALASEEPVAQFPLAAYIGHDGLMEFALPERADARRGPGREAIALCCVSRDYFGPELEKAGAKPVLLTTQLMYPGAFILRDSLTGWMAEESPEQIRQRAAVAYARNQRISVKAAAGVFTTTTAKAAR